MSEEPSETPAQPEVLTRVDSGEGTLQRSVEGVAGVVAASVAANLATPYVKAAIDGVVQKVKDHNAPEVIHLPPTESESFGSE